MDTPQSSGDEDVLPCLSAIKPGFKRPLSSEKVVNFEKCLNECTEHWHLSAETPLPGIMCIDGALSQEECDNFIAAIDDCEDVSFWNSAGREDRNARLFRDADTIEVQSPTIARALWARVKDIFKPTEITVGNVETDKDWERDLVGTWQAISLNHDLLFAKYPSGGHFSPHTDGRAVHDFNTRSFFSVVIFLNSVPMDMGAGTNFFTAEAVRSLCLSPCGNYWRADPSTLLNEVSASAGRMLLFHQSMVHEGVAPLFPFTKYIIRSDVIYTRDPPLCNSPQDKTAYELFQKGELLAEEGKTEDAINLFRRAFKLSPELATIMGQS